MNRAEFRESIDQFLASWGANATLKPTGQVVREPGLTLSFGDLAWPLMNAACFTEPVSTEADWEQRAVRARDFFRARHRAWNLVVCEDWLTPQGTAVLARLGLKPLMTVSGMVAEALAPPTRPPPAELTFRRAQDLETRLAVGRINTAAYGVPVEWGDEICERAQPLWSGGDFAFVGYVDGQPATCAVTSRFGDCLYVSWVATLAEHRQKGYAEAVMRQGLAEAARFHGLTRTVLHATPAGFPVYQRMGYRPVTGFTILGEG